MQDVCLFWGSVQMHSGWHAVNIDFQPLGLKVTARRGEGGILGTIYLKFKSLHFHNIHNL
jgi:hypothetical protein